MNTHEEGWDDFTHTTQNASVSAHELFERYLEFEGLIAGLSRKELVARHWLKAIDDDSLETVFFDLPLAKQPTLFRKSAKADENLLAIGRLVPARKRNTFCLRKVDQPSRD